LFKDGAEWYLAKRSFEIFVFSFGKVVGAAGIGFVVNPGFFDEVLSVVPTIGSVVTESSKDESPLFDSSAVKLVDV